MRIYSSYFNNKIEIKNQYVLGLLYTLELCFGKFWQVLASFGDLCHYVDSNRKPNFFKRNGTHILI